MAADEDETPVDIKPRSREVTEGPSRAPARAMLRAIGMTDDDWEKPQVAVASSWNEVTPCNLPLDRLAKRSKEGVRAAGGFPIGLTVARSSLAAATPEGLMGTTFGGGPMALAAAAEVSRRIAAPGFLEHVRDLSAAFRSSCVRGPVASVRGAGLLLGLVLEPEHKAAAVRDALLAQGVLVGTCDDPGVLRLSPALNLPDEAPARLAAALDALGGARVGAGRAASASGARP